MATSRRLFRHKLFWIVLVAFVVRLVVMVFLYPRDLDPRFEHWFFGFEEGRVARAIAEGHGFSNPLWGQTGPTAWYVPVYPYLIAADFKVFGICTKSACIAILTFQALVSALTCLPIFFFARRSFSEGAALAASWVWVAYPYAVYWPIIRIWDTWLTTLLLAILFCIILKLERSQKVLHWIGFGLLSGFTALTSPAVLSVLPVLALWALWRLHRQGKKWLAPAIACLLTVVLVILPWVIRDYRTFHKFIPLRDNLGLEFRIGNNGDTSDTYILLAGPWIPWTNDTQWNDFARMGEVNYFHWEGQQAAAYIKAHPLSYTGMIGRRILFVWTGFWSVDQSYLARQTLEPLVITLLTLLSALTFLGLRRAFRAKGAGAIPYAIVLALFPLVYYLTEVARWHRCPMGPMIIVLATYEVHSWFASRKQERRASQDSGLPAMIPAESGEPRISPVARRLRAYAFGTANLSHLHREFRG